MTTINMISGGSRISQTGRCQPLSLEQNLLFDKIFIENCMKMKEIGRKGRGVLIPSAPPRSTGDDGQFAIVWPIVMPKQKFISQMVQHLQLGQADRFQ